jgi:hypothetical protein
MDQQHPCLVLVSPSVPLIEFATTLLSLGGKKQWPVFGCQFELL